MLYETHDRTGAVVLCYDSAPNSKPGFTVREATPEELEAISQETGALYFDGERLVRVSRQPAQFSV